MEKHIKRNFLFIVLFFFEYQGFAATYTFIGSGPWSSSSNWDVYGIPPNPLLSGDTIIVDGAGSAKLDINQTIQVGSFLKINSLKVLTLDANLIINETILLINSGSLLINNYTLSVNQAIPNLTTGYIDNRGILINNGTINIYEGAGINNQGGYSMKNEGIINIMGGTYSASIVNASGDSIINNSIINIDSNGVLTNIGALVNNGSLYNKPHGGIENLSTATLVNTGSGTIVNYLYAGISNRTLATITNSGTLTNNGVIDNQHILRNNASIYNNGSLRNNGLDSLINNGTVFNNGTLDNEGVFLNNYSLNNSGVFNNLPPLGQLLLNFTPANFPGGTFNWNVGSEVIIGPSGTMTLTSPTVLQAGKKLTVAPGGSLIIQQ